MPRISVKILQMEGAEDLPLPAYASHGAAGLDLYAANKDALIIAPQKYLQIPTGIALALPKNYEAQIRPRSGLAFHYGVTVLNNPGTIDSDYRGEIKILLINHGTEDFTVTRGIRIAQMVIGEYCQVDLEITDNLPMSKRNHAGFGSTGI